MYLNPGYILHDRYQIIGKLGEGGFAITYTANDLDQPENSPCVVKEIQPPQSTVTEVLQQASQQFQREVEALRLLGHNSRIPEYYHSFQNQENGNFYLVQEYIEGHPLSQEFTNGRQWTEEETVALLLEIIEILQFVHQKNVIHRDLKPSNLIRRQSDGQIVLIDFGAVKEISSLEITESGETKTRTIYTPGYTSPEQMHGCPQFCSDIYSAGIIGIQAVTGLRPASDLLTHSQGDIVWRYSTPNQPMVEISLQLENVLNNMVSYYFPNRYQSAADVLQDLRSPPPPPPPPPDRLKIGLSIAIALVAAAGAIAAYYSIFSSKTNLVLPDGLSAGDKILVTSSSPWLKQRAVDEFAASKSQSAFNSFKESWNKEDGKDPETLIYMNNAFLEARNVSYYTIAVAVPIRRKNPDSSAILADQAKEVLRGVAQAQMEVNLGLRDFSTKDFPGQGFLEGKAIKGKGLKVVIADDANSKSEARERAKSLVKQPDILAVVGHTNSDMTMHAVDIYDRNNLVLISPGTSTEELTEFPRKYFFRTPYTSKLMAKSLAEYLTEKNQKKAVVLYNPASPFGAYFQQEFKKSFQDSRRGKIAKIRDFDLSKKDFNAQRAIKEIEANGETAIALVPDAQVTSSLDSAFLIVKFNRDRNWIVGAWTLMRPQTLELASQQHLFKKLVFSVGWHPLNSPNKKFPQSARSLWGGEVNTRTALAYDAARALIEALEMPQPSREGMQKTLASPDFSAYGATGTIQFDSPNNGDRKNPPSDLVHIVECPKEQFGLAFVPVKYPTAAAAGLKCDRNNF
ncbi:bifunctional serine/threonine-protein kinase/ABC transporter substrate-binding protein [Microcoleus sp. herbarium7]|uniref:bifunctional serine/threonine-protein kinase/ABC transporter substrate-binding protein n=1 Tax=Microcoleus sp. herbarium7 TaxID=3055435 RepID=UPI002FD49B94